MVDVHLWPHFERFTKDHGFDSADFRKLNFSALLSDLDGCGGFNFDSRTVFACPVYTHPVEFNLRYDIPVECGGGCTYTLNVIHTCSEEVSARHDRTMSCGVKLLYIILNQWWWGKGWSEDATGVIT